MIHLLKSWFMRLTGAPTCEEIVLFSYAYLEGQLAPERQRKFREHLKGCSTCTQFVEGYREVARPDKLAKVASLDADFEERVIEFLKSEHAKEGGVQ